MRSDQPSRDARGLGGPLRPSSRFSQYIRQVPFLACLSAEERKSLEEVFIERKYEKDQTVLLEEDCCKYFYIIYSGKVKVLKSDPDGREHIVAIHNKGDFFGEVGILDGNTSPATVIAMERSHIALISKYNFEKHILTNQKVLRELLKVFCARMRDSWIKIKVLGLRHAERRVRAVLGFMARQHGVVKPGEDAVLPRLRHADIANYCSLSRETVTRQLQRLAQDDEIHITADRRIVLKSDFFRNAEIL